MAAVISNLWATPTPTPNVVPISDGSASLDAWMTSGTGGGDIQALLDTISTEHGALLVRGPSAWEAISPGPAGYVLTSNGSGAIPSWEPGETISPLLNLMVDWWQMDELSGTRIGSHAGLDLTDVNGVGNAAGIDSTTAAAFVAASSQKLTRASEAALQVGNIDFSACIWVYHDTKATFFGIVGKYGAQREWLLYYDLAGDVYRFLVSDDGSNAFTVPASTYGSPPNSTWSMLYVEHDATADTIAISVNAGVLDSTSYGGGVFVGTEPFLIGQTATAGQYLNGRAQKCGYWKRKLTSAEILELYNAGNGALYPFS